MGLIEKAAELRPDLETASETVGRFIQAESVADFKKLQQVMNGEIRLNRDQTRILITKVNQWIYFFADQADSSTRIPQYRVNRSGVIERYFPDDESKLPLETGEMGRFGKLGQ